MKIYYFIHITGTDTGISGIPRVVKNLGRELFWRDTVDLVPVCWSDRLEGRRFTSRAKLIDNLARHNGPPGDFQNRARHTSRSPSSRVTGCFSPRSRISAVTIATTSSVSIDEPIGYARQRGIRVAALLHDIMPLTYQLGSERRRAFADLVPETGDDLTRLQFTVYAHALAQADLVLPVSETSGALLNQWLVRHGHDEDALPPIVPILLPEEVHGVRRVVPQFAARDQGAAKEFLTVGTVCAHKNQLSTMTAFQRLVARRPELDIRLNVVGIVSPDSAVPASLLAKRAKGQIVLHGYMPDQQLEVLNTRAYASVFVSLAEGYGLPVAESLWHGKPCICSNEGSIAEIAKGGGCVPVDPQNLDQIEAAIEALATDWFRYNELLQQIALRKIKTWREYAGAVVEHLHACSAEGPAALKKMAKEGTTARFSLEHTTGEAQGRRVAVFVFSSSR